MTFEKDKIPDYIKAVLAATDEQLVHVLKVAMTKDKDKKDWKKLEDAVQKERRKRNIITTISSKIVSPSLKSKEKDSNTANPDDYD